jgi:hypothetical protein
LSGLSFVAAVALGVGSLTGLIPLSPGTATALTILLAAVALLPPLPTLMAESTRDLGVVVSHVLNLVKKRETRLFDDLVGTAAPLDLRFTLVRLPGRQATAGANRGQLRRVAPFYQQVETGRLVILGPGGAGKTVLLLELMIRLLDNRRHPDGLVPVRLSLSRWNVSLGLEAWLSAEVATQNEIAYADAKALVDAGRILPMLDGLDEMDPEHEEHPRRAATALRQLNAYRRGGKPAPLVLTCRDNTYDRLVERREHLTGAVAIRLAELKSQQIRDHIHDIVADTRRWKEVVRELTRQPSGSLARALELPWRLAMILWLYEERPDGGYVRSPSQLVAAASGPADTALVPLYARALLGSRLLGSGRRASGRAERALATLGAYLLANLDRPKVVGERQLPTIDMVVHQLWPVAGLRIPRAVTAAISAILWGPTVVAALWLLGQTDWSPPVEAMILVVAAVFPAISVRASLQCWPHPKNIVISRLHERQSLARLLLSLVVAAAIGALLSGLGSLDFAIAFAGGFGGVFGLGIALAVRDTAPTNVLLRVGAVVGLLFGWLAQAFVGFLDVIGGLVAGVGIGGLALIAAAAIAVRAPQASPGHATNPVFRSFVQNDLRTGVTAGLAAAAVVGLILHLSPDLSVSWLATVLICLSVACSIGLGLVADAWRRYAAMLLCANGRLPLRLNRTLERAYAVGLLRRAGIAYQFRHLELRDHFGGHQR